jgi:PAS domain S-box-containing protein
VNNKNTNNNTSDNQGDDIRLRDKLFAEAKLIASFGYWYYSFATRNFFFSDEVYNFLDIEKTPDREYISFEKIKEYLTESEGENILNIREEVLAGKLSSINQIIHIFSQDHSSKYIEFRGKVLEQDGEVYITGTAIDITDSYFMNGIQEEKKKTYKNIYEKLTDIFIIFKPVYNEKREIVDFRFVDVNNAFLKKYDIRKSDILEYSLNNQRNFFDKLFSLLKISCITGEPQQDRLFISEFDSFYDVLIYLPSPGTIATVWRDVSLLVDVDNAVRESEVKYRELFLRSNDAIFMVEDATGRILDVNTAGTSMTGYSKDELTGSEIFDIIYNRDSYVEAINNVQSRCEIRVKMIRKDNSLFQVESSCSFFNWGGRKVYVLSIRNIENRIKENARIVESEKRLSKLLDNLNTAVLIITGNTITRYNKKAMALFGVPETGLKGKALWELSPEKQNGNIESRIKIAEQLHLTHRNEEVEVEWLFLYDRKHVFTSKMKLSSFKFKDEEYIVASIWDVSSNKRLENELISNEKRWRHSLKISNIGVWEWDIVTNEVYYSDVWKSIIGFEPDEISNRFEEFEKRVHKDDITYVFNQIEAYVEKKSPVFDVTFRMRCKNGSYKWINASGEIYSYTKNGKPQKFIGTHIDITRYKVQEKRYIKQTNRYVEAAKEAKMGVWGLNLKSMVITAPDETLALFGFSPQQTITLKSIENLVHPEDYHLFVSQFFSNDEKNPVKLCVFRIIEKNSIRFISSYVYPEYDEQQRHVGFRGVFQDVTSYKQQELHFKNELLLNKQLMKNTSQAMLIYQDDEIVYVNENSEKLLGYSVKEIKNEHDSVLDMVIHEDKEAVAAIYNNVLNKNIKKEIIDVRIQTKNNRVKWVEVLFTNINYNDHKALMILLIDINKRKRNEIKLSESEILSRETVENNPFAIAYADSDLNLIRANKQFYEMVDIRLYSSIEKKYLSNIFQDVDIKEIKLALAKLKTRKITIYALECLLTNNIIVKLYIEALQADFGESDSYIFYFENIDIYKRQIEGLSDQNFSYKNAVNYSKAGIALFNQKGESLLYNPVLTRLFDIEVDDDSKIYFNDLFIMNNHKPLKYSDILSGDFGNMSFNQKLFPNRVLFFEIQKADLISSEGILLVVRDITENHKQNVILNKKLSRYTSIFEHSPLGIAILNKKREIVLCNNSYAQTFKKPKDELLNTTIDKHVKTSHISDIVAGVDELFSGIKNHVSDVYGIQPNPTDKAELYVSSYYSKYNDEYGDVSYVIQVVNDVTKDIEKFDTNVDRGQKQVLSKLAHSFAEKVHRNISIIQSNVSFISTLNEDENKASILDNIFQSVRVLSYENSSLLAFKHPLQIMKCEVELKSIIDDVFSDALANKDISVHKDYSDEKYHILANPVHMRIIFQNILNNAVEASQNKGNIDVNSKIVYFNATTKISDIELKKGKYLRIRMSDDGEGIKSDNIKHVFKPFFTTREPWDHAGLGLAVARRLVVSYEGEILIKSRDKKGTVVSIYLPVVDDDYALSLAKPDEFYMPGFNANVLIVNSEDVVRTVMVELLKQLGYNVIGFKNVNSALRFYRNNLSGIEVVILDENLEEKSDLNQFSSFTEMNSNVNVIIVKTNDSKTTNKEGLFFLKKPVSIEKLNNILTQVLVNS